LAGKIYIEGEAMKSGKKETYFLLIFIMGFMSLCAVFLNIMALNDINNDYVSQEVLKQAGISGIEKLPDWSRCGLEWGAITVAHLFLLMSLITLIVLLFKFKSSKPGGK